MGLIEKVLGLFGRSGGKGERKGQGSVTGTACDRTRSAIEGLGDGMVKPSEWLFARKHMRSCPECASYCERMRAVLEAFEEMERVGAPGDFADSLMELLRGWPSVEAETGLGWGRRGFVYLAGAAGAGAAVALAITLRRRLTGRQETDNLAPAGSA